MWVQPLRNLDMEATIADFSGMQVSVDGNWFVAAARRKQRKKVKKANKKEKIEEEKT